MNENNNDDKKKYIKNSTADFLVFTKNAGDTVEVRVQDNNVWLTQKALGQLFDVDRSVVTKHLTNIFKEGELDEKSTCANFAQVADNGKTYQYKRLLRSKDMCLIRRDLLMGRYSMMTILITCYPRFRKSVRARGVSIKR